MKKESSRNATGKRSAHASVDEYLATIPEEARNALEDLRRTIRKIVPDAVEVISYQIPTFKYKGRGLVAFSAHKNHYSFHLMSTSVMNAYKDQLKLYDTTKSSVHFTTSKTLPPTLVKKLILARIEENEERKTRQKK